MKYAICLSIVSLFFIYGKRDDKKPISYLVIYKMPFNIMFATGLESSRFLTKEWINCLDTFAIKDETILKRITKEIKLSKSAPEYRSIDTRAAIIIKYQSGDVDSLYLGSTVIIKQNGICKQLRNRRLIEFVDSLPSTRYNNCQ